jgi:uroporphyrin-III C-methyltransferase/precorrin-2 dehydrogenase/sirohydrochlorin ferrochelatase
VPPASVGIAPIPTLPLFFKLGGRRVLLAGGSLPAVWKAELLAAAGARVQVADATPCAEMEDLARVRPEAIELVRRAWRATDLAGAALAIGALDGDDAVAFRDAARAAGVPVNIIDVPHLCDVQFGTIVERSPLLVAISTDGAAPVFGQALRARIEALLPESLRRWAAAAKAWRPDLQRRGLGFAARRTFWEMFSDRALDGSDRPPDEADRVACLDAALGVATKVPGGLWLVGVGPGEADLLTLRAVRALQSADVIVHDAGLGEALLSLGRREARRMVELPDDRQTAALIETFVGEGRTTIWAARGDPIRCHRWQARKSAVTPGTAILGLVAGLTCDPCPSNGSLI